MHATVFADSVLDSVSDTYEKALPGAESSAVRISSDAVPLDRSAHAVRFVVMINAPIINAAKTTMALARPLSRIPFMGQLYAKRSRERFVGCI